VNQRQSQKHAGVSDVTNHLVTNQINAWSSTSGSLSWGSEWRRGLFAYS